MRWLFPAQDVRIDSTCLDCGEPLSVRFRDEEILALDPPELVAHTVTSFFAGSGGFTSSYR